ncbi:helix-turn-helix transcriptional regulator [Amycolatopsis nigrescens]|uniref:helix-turn-helix transcriptional regulator n=1 Tax=Amycolatopsis nigrescens TaxID=381445 RepID=UPI000475572C|nr:LuxR C-terminal-related transcriptional regulator [Amycolatopsis nigrescens]
MDVLRVLIRAVDPLTREAISSRLDALPDIEVLPDEHHPPVDVVVLVAERITVEVASALRKVKATLGAPVVLIACEVSRTELLTAVECNVVAVLPRAGVTGDRIESAVRTAAGGGAVLPSKMLGELLKQVERIQREILSPNGLHTSGMTAREIDILRLMSDGLDTAEIAVKLGFSERVVKRTIFGVTSRFKLRNRPHAVAYALRTGVI